MGQSRIWAYCEVLTEFLGLNPPLTESYGNTETRKFLASFHRGDGRANYTYGERWHVNSAFQKILRRLQDDRYSRQAVMNIWDSSLDLDPDETNVPCTIMHQFLIRADAVGNDYLHTNVYMRSNDFFKGWKYDIFLNSFIAEAFAGALNCEVGDITFFVGSFHVYTNEYARLRLFNMTDWNTATYSEFIPFRLPFENLYEQLWAVKRVEEVSRFNTVPLGVLENLHPHFRKWAADFIDYNNRRVLNAPNE